MAPVAQAEGSPVASNDYRAPLLPHSVCECPLWDELLAAPPPSLEGTTVCLKPDLPVGGRLTRFLHFWHRLTSDPWVLSVIERGYVFPFKRPPRLTGKRVTRSSVSELCEEVVDLSTKCAVEPVPQVQQGLGFYSTYFVVPKKDGGLRPILNLKPFNKSLHRVRFKMETLRTVIAVVQQGNWLASVDLKDAYLHVPVARAMWRYLRFSLPGAGDFQWRVLPFGLSLAPFVFTRIVFTVVAWLRCRGIRLHAYLDDLLLVGDSPQEVQQAVLMTMQVLMHAGFIINLKKSDLVPTQELVYIGALLSPLKGQVLLPVDRRAALIRALSSFSRVGALHSTRLWMQVIGLMAATIQCVPDARLRMRPIQWHVKNRWTSGSFDQLIMVTCKVREALLWWTCPLNLAQGLPLDPPSPQLTVTTDASIEGWGGHSLVQGQTLLFSGIWSPHERAHCHINLLELRAIRLTLMKLRDCIRGLTVKVECDNTTAVSYLNKQGGTISQSLCQEAVILHEWARQMDVHLIAVHRPGVCNELADYLSRNRPDPTEWSLAQQSYNLIVSRWGQPQLDLFASPANHKAALWFSRLPHPGAAAVDAFNQSWTGWSVYAFPPFNLILKTLLKVRADRVQEVIMVTPHWPKRQWFPLLLQMATEPPLRLPLRIDLLHQKLADRGVLYHPDLRTLELTAWRLTGALG